MAESYTDEEFWQLEVPSLDARAWATFTRLQRERDEARRVAKVLALEVLQSTLLLDDIATNARDSALAYPDTE